MSKKIKVPDIYSTYDFVEVGNSKDYRVVDKEGNSCGWIRKFCVDKGKIIKK